MADDPLGLLNEPTGLFVIATEPDGETKSVDIANLTDDQLLKVLADYGTRNELVGLALALVRLHRSRAVVLERVVVERREAIAKLDADLAEACGALYAVMEDGDDEAYSNANAEDLLERLDPDGNYR